MYEVLVCECCALLIANGDDSGCRDYYEHDHPECNLGLERGEVAVVEVEDDRPIRYYECAGCGEGPYMGQPVTVTIIAA